jgi:hypothetical protein
LQTLTTTAGSVTTGNVKNHGLTKFLTDR